jgi:DNA helicase-2/ATP-dependent DNA helicase PcrA
MAVYGGVVRAVHAIDRWIETTEEDIAVAPNRVGRAGFIGHIDNALLGARTTGPVWPRRLSFRVRRFGESGEPTMSDRDHIFSDHDFIEDDSVRSEAIEELLARLASAPVDTTDALAEFMPDADDYQRKVIDARDHTMRMLAPAGSGKTQTLINRVLERVKEGMRPSRLLVLTFDNAAATALRVKLEAQLAQLGDTSSSLRDLTISTLNAFGYRLLRDYFPEERRQIIPEGRRHRFARDALDSLKEKSPQRHASLAPNLRTGVYLDFFGILKNELFDPRRFDAQTIADFILGARQSEPFFADSSEDGSRRVVQSLVWLYQAYEQRLIDQKLMDFDDQKLRAFVELRENVDVLSTIQSSRDEVIVDEFQDINRLDFELIRLIAEKASLVVTGDDDQAIYGFRGCSPEYIVNLEKHLGRLVASYELSINYRCPPNIVTHADRLIRHNTRRVPKEPIPARTDNALIKVAALQTAGVEAQVTVALINKVIKGQPGLGFDDFAVLYRTNAQSLPLQVEFVLHDVPYFVRSEDNILENEALGRLLALLRLKLTLDGAGDRASIDDQVMALGSYFRFWNPQQQAAARAVLSARSDFIGAIRSPELNAAIPKTRGSVADAFEKLRAARSLQQTLEVIAKDFHGVRGMVGSLEDAMTEQVPLGEVFELANHFGGSLEDFVEMMEKALARARRANAGKAEDGVQLLTYFKSKGRQWHTVILTTCNEGLIPHSRAPIEDERRLFYVAMTRASANLMISYLGSAIGKRVAPSRFLTEAGLL